MDWQLYLAFVVASSILILIPGPNVALIVGNAVAFGTRYGLLTVVGTSAAMVIQLALFAAGMTALLGVLAAWFEWIRWIGVAYLLWIGVAQWRAPPVDLTRVVPERRPVRDIVLRGVLVSMTNPKTLVFYGAFFPQFISPAVDMTAQVLLLSATFLGVAVLLDGAWAVLAGQARGLLGRHGRLRNRLSGALLVGAGVGLALARVRQ